MYTYEFMYKAAKQTIILALQRIIDSKPTLATQRCYGLLKKANQVLSIFDDKIEIKDLNPFCKFSILTILHPVHMLCLVHKIKV